MRLPEVGTTLDLSEKLALRRRLEELAAANINTVILTAAQAETGLSLASQAGLYAMVEIAIDADEFASPARLRALTAWIAEMVSGLRGHPALFGFLIDCPCEVGQNARPAKEKPASAKCAAKAVHGLDTIIRVVRETDRRFLIALKRRAKQPIVPESAVAQPGAALNGEDLTFASLAKIDVADVTPIIYALHESANARPLILEIAEEIPGQDEVVARAFGCGVAGVVAPAMRRAVSSERQNIRMLSPRERLPFAHFAGSSGPWSASTPTVSVLVTARDDERTISACLESISRLQYPAYEVIVIDDASRDRSLEIASRRPGVRLFRHSSRAGFGAIRSAAIRGARGDLIAFTRADCLVDEDWLTLARYALIEGRCDAVGGPIFRSQEGHGVAARVRCAIEHTGAKRSSGGPELRFGERNMLARKSSLIAGGGFAGWFIDESGDRDLAARMTAAGLRLGWCPASLVWRGGHPTLGEFLRQRICDARAEARLAIAALGSCGAIAQALARRHRTAATVTTTPPSRAARCSAVAIGNHRTPTAHPAGR